MKVKIFYDPHCTEYSAPGHPERPARLAQTVPLPTRLHGDWEWCQPQPPKERNLLRAHSREHVERVANATEDFDVDTPAYPKIDSAAPQSAGAAIAAPRAAASGERAFSMTRQPGD